MLTPPRFIGIALASERWPGVESALELYENLVTACLQVYDGSAESSYVIRSPSNRPSQAPLHNVVTPPSLSSASTVASSTVSHQDQDFETVVSRSSGTYEDGNSIKRASPEVRSELPVAQSLQSDETQNTALLHQHTPVAFDPRSIYNALPVNMPTFQHWNLGYTEDSQSAGDSALYMRFPDEEIYMGTIGDQYSQYLHAPYFPHQPLQSLSQEQQVELMTNLEKTGVFGWI